MASTVQLRVFLAGGGAVEADGVVLDAGRFAGLAPWRPPNWNEADTSDKPAWVQNLCPMPSGKQNNIDNFRRVNAALDTAGIKHVAYEAPGTAHEFQTWRKSLHGFAQLIFK